jgi:hypothetical protein
MTTSNSKFLQIKFSSLAFIHATHPPSLKHPPAILHGATGRDLYLSNNEGAHHINTCAHFDTMV